MTCLAGVLAAGARAESAGAEVYVADLNLRTAIEKALGIQPGYAIRQSDMERLRAVDVSGSAYDVLDLTGLQHAVNLERADLRGNRIVDIAPLAELPALRRIELDDNRVTDISPLVANAGIGSGDQVFLAGNPLDATAIAESIPALESKGVFVSYGDDHGNSISTATALALGGTSSGGIDRASDADYFGFEVSSTADVAVFTTGADTRGELLTRAGLTLASDTASGAHDNFLIRQRLEPGHYYVRVTGARGSYTIHTIEGVAVHFPNANLRAVVADALGDAASDGVTSSALATLTGTLDAGRRGIDDLGGLEFAVNVTDLKLNRNRLRDITALSSLVSLVHLDLERNAVTDVAPLAANPGLDAGDRVFLAGNRLSEDSVNVAIPALQRRGVFVGRADDHGDEPSGAAVLALGDAASASIYPSGDRDVFRLRIDVAADVAIYTTGDVDTAGVLRDAEGRFLTANDNTGGRTNFMIARRLDAGDYYLHVRGAEESTRGPYTVEAHEDPNAAALPDLNLRAAVADTMNKAPEAAITPVDLAALTSLSAAGHGIRNLSGLESAANLTHIDLDKNRIVDIAPLADLTALEELRLVGNAVRDVAPLVGNIGLGDGDRVFLQGNPLSTTAANEQIPALAARGVAVVFADDHANRASAATALALDGSSAGTIHSELDRDYFRLTVSGTTTDVAVFTTGGVDVVGTLTNRRGAQLATDDDGGAGTNFFLRAALEPGDYYIEVDGYADSLGAYVVHALAEEAVQIPDDGLRIRVEGATGAAARSPLTTASLASLEALDASITRISNLAGLDAAVNLRRLALRHNRIEDVQILSALTRLVELDLQGNRLVDVAALADNAGLGEGDKVVLADNPLGRTALDVQLPALAERGVFVGYLDDHGDARLTATALDPGGRAAGTLSTVDDEDVFRVVLPAAADVAFYTTGPTDTVGWLAAAGVALRVTDNDGGVGDNFAIRRRLEAGARYVTVSGSGPGLAGVGPYVLHAPVAPTAPPANITVLRDRSSLVVTWDPVLADLASGTITRYRVVATPSDGGAPLGCTAGPNADGCTIVGLADGVDYTVTVNAVNAVGFGPAGTVAPPDPSAADVPLTSFWRGWRLSLAEPAAENGAVDD